MPRTSLWPYLFLTTVFLGLTLTLVAKQGIAPHETYDESVYHYPTVLAFAHDLPQPNLTDYQSATTPLYHLTLAGLTLVVGTSILSLRLASAGFSLACILIIYTFLRQRKGRSGPAVFFCLLILFSPYFLGPAIRLGTDNAAVVWVVLTLMLLEPIKLPRPNVFAAALSMLFAVLTRQINAWLAAVMLWRMKPAKGTPLSVTSLWKMLWPILPATVVLTAFFILWRGPTPPAFISHSRHLSPQAPIYIVSLLAVYGLFFFPWFLTLWHQYQPRLSVLALFISTGLALLALTSLSPLTRTETGGMLWLLAEHLPRLAGTSLIFWLLLPIGLIWLYLLGCHLTSSNDYLFPVAFIAWALSNILNAKIYQRYFDTLLLVFLGYALMDVKPNRKMAWLSPAVLLLAFALRVLLRYYL